MAGNGNSGRRRLYIKGQSYLPDGDVSNLHVLSKKLGISYAAALRYVVLTGFAAIRDDWENRVR